MEIPVNKKKLLLLALMCATSPRLFSAADPDLTPTASASSPSPETESITASPSLISPSPIYFAPEQHSDLPTISPTESATPPAPPGLRAIQQPHSEEGYDFPKYKKPILEIQRTEEYYSPDVTSPSSTPTKRSSSPSLAGPAPKRAKVSDFPEVLSGEEGQFEYDTAYSPRTVTPGSRTAEFTPGSTPGTPPSTALPPATTPFAVGFSTIETSKPGKIPQDEYAILESGPYKLYGIFDGHSDLGEFVAEYTKNNLLTRINKKLENGLTPDDAMKTAFEEINTEILGRFDTGGTTAIVALVNGNNITLANTGDSRAVVASYPANIQAGTILAAKILLDTKDHKPVPGLPAGPDGISEYIRLLNGLKSGSYGESPYPEEKFIEKNILIRGRVADSTFQKYLAVSRSIGDKTHKPHGVIATPEIYKYILSTKIENPFIILACDGVWDVITSQDAANIVASSLERNQNDGTQAARDLAQQARYQESQDDITVIVIPIAPQEFSGAGPAPALSPAGPPTTG